jgi:hypothetical protein
VICLSLVGAANSVSSALAKLLTPNGRLFFVPAEGIAWDEPRIFMRDPDTHYKELGVRLRTTVLTHGLCLACSAHLGDGLLHPPRIPAQKQPSEQPETSTDIRPHQPAGGATAPPSQERSCQQAAQLRALLAHVRPRYLLGNWSETTPNERGFLGVLRGLRVILVNAPPHASPTLIATMHQWANALWYEGSQRTLITPLPALGIRAWRLSGDLGRWSDLISQGVRKRWLERPTA